MVIYVEYLIIDNFFLTYLICDLSYVISGRKKSKKRAFIASAIATITAFAYPYVIGSPLAVYSIKAILWIVMSLILFLKKQKIALSSLIFLVVTLFVGGVLTFITTLQTPLKDGLLGRANFSFPIGVIVMIGYVALFITKRIYIALSSRKTDQELIKTVKIRINGKTFLLKAFVDTGNRLMDGKSGLPVVIVKVSAVISAFSPAMFADLIERGRKGNCISYLTVTGGVNKIMLIYPELFEIEGVKDSVDVALGLSFSGFYGDYDVILHPSLS